MKLAISIENQFLFEYPSFKSVQDVFTAGVNDWLPATTMDISGEKYNQQFTRLHQQVMEYIHVDLSFMIYFYVTKRWHLLANHFVRTMVNTLQSVWVRNHVVQYMMRISIQSYVIHMCIILLCKRY